MAKEEILQLATMRFIERGATAVHLEDIATELNISMDELHEHFKTKDALLEESMMGFLSFIEKQFNGLFNTSNNAIEEIRQVAAFGTEMYNTVKPSLLHDLQSYYRPLWNKIEAVLSKLLVELTVSNIIRGVSGGLYRADIDAFVVANLLAVQVLTTLDENVFSFTEYDRTHLVEQSLTYHINGLVSDEGYRYLQQNPIFAKK